MYDDQQKCFLDKRRRRVLTGTRQLGKSTLAAVELIDAGLNNPGSASVFLDFDITHAEKVLLEDFDRLLSEYTIPAKIVNEELHFDNGSIVYIFSGRPSEIKKLQGMKFALIVTDESQDSEALEEIFKLVKPAMIKYRGRILAMGIPGHMREIGYWWDICEGKAAHLWGQHRGDMRRNPFLPEDTREEMIAEAKEEYGAESPYFMRHWLGIWPTADNSLRMFRYSRELNGYDGDPPPCKFYSLGLDPGGTLDAEAVIVVGHGNADGHIWHVDEDVSEKKQGGDWDVTGERVGPMVRRWKPTWRGMDYGSANKNGQIIRYQNDALIRMEAVPDKDPEQEAMRINILFNQRRLWIKRGSKLERDLLYTIWDADELANGKVVQSKKYKQNAGDALRAAMWGVRGYMHLITKKEPLNEEQREAERIEKIKASRPQPKTLASAVEILTQQRPPVKKGGPFGPPMNNYGLP